MARANDISNDAPHFRRLSDSQLDRLHQGTLDILETIGIRFPEPTALGYLPASGIPG